MKLLLTILAVAVVVLFITLGGQAQSSRCATGHVRGFATVTGDVRLGGVGAILNQWYSDPLYFGIRYNCTGRGVQVKRIDEGVFDIMFPTNPARVAQVSALRDGASASAYRVDDYIFRVVIRGPLIKNEILVLRDSPFQITVM